MPKIIRHKLAGSVEANIDKLADIISKQLTNGISSPTVRELAEDIIKGIPERDRAGEIRAIHKWCIENKRFTRDPYSLELLESPRRLAYEYHKKGKVLADCESISTFEAALLGTIGHRTRVMLIDANPYTREFSHALAQVYYGGKWVSLDTSRDGRIGWCAPHTRQLLIESE